MSNADALKKLELMRKLREELSNLEQNEQIQRLDAVMRDVNEVRVKYELSEDEFATLMLATYKKPRANSKRTEMVKVKIGSTVEEWPSSRTGRLPPEIVRLMNKHGAKNYVNLVNILRVKN